MALGGPGALSAHRAKDRRRRVPCGDHPRRCPLSDPSAGPGRPEWGRIPRPAGGAKPPSPWPFPRARKVTACPRGTPGPLRALQGPAGPLSAKQPPGGVYSCRSSRPRCRQPTGRYSGQGYGPSSTEGTTREQRRPDTPTGALRPTTEPREAPPVMHVDGGGQSVGLLVPPHFRPH